MTHPANFPKPHKIMLKSSLLTSVFSVVSFSSLLADDSFTTAHLLDLARECYAVEDQHNGDIYKELAVMKHESEGESEPDWTSYRNMKSKLKDRSAKPFSCDAVEFFKATSNSDEKRVCFVIDFSQSMKGKRIKLLRHELTDTINHMPDDSQVSVVFFAGPTWIPGDSVTQQKNKFNYVVEHAGLEYDWKGKGAHNWTFDTEPALPSWTLSDGVFKSTMAQSIEKQKLVFGTDWRAPLATALSMDPLPDVIYFMTDGACSTADEASKLMAHEAKKRKVRINTIAMMEPKAEKPMRFMANKTGGDFVIITEDCECHVEKAGDVSYEESDKETPKKKKRKKAKN